MAFSKSFLDELRARISMVELVGRRVALKKRGRDHWGCCPFHNEKTASFKVSEDRDDYHCFGCGAHGSAIDFVMQTEGLTFPETIERLAESAGMEVPRMDPADRQKADRQSRLAEACEAAAKWFQAQLRAPVGDPARTYLTRRGVGEAAVEGFRLGFAPDRNDGLKVAMLDRGFTEADLVEAGLIARPDDGRPAYDRFRNRLMFPIGDRRGRVIAFGGRALGEARAKYLNSPETPLFDKGRSLYNHAMAREESRGAGSVIVVEGYMDAIALAEGGFRNVVAPLGTALTEDQIGLLWQMTAEPMICLDGDQAGLRAAMRAAERALPLLKPGKSLRFVMLAEGMDPDDLIRGEGAEAFRTLLRGSGSLADMLWRGLMADRELDSPDRRAALERDIDRTVFTITDETVRRHYRDDLKDRMRAQFRAASQAANPRPSRAPDGGAPPAGARSPRRGAGQGDGRWGGGRWGGGQGGSGQLGSGQWGSGRWAGRQNVPEDVSRIRAAVTGSPLRLREEALLGALLKWPVLAAEFEQELDEVHFHTEELDRCLVSLREALIRDPGLDSGALARHLQAAGLDKLVARLCAPNAAKLDWTSREDAPDDMVREMFDATLRRYRVEVLQAEYEDAAEVARREVTTEAYERMMALRRALDIARADEPTAFRNALGRA